MASFAFVRHHRWSTQATWTKIQLTWFPFSLYINIFRVSGSILFSIKRDLPSAISIEEEQEFMGNINDKPECFSEKLGLSLRTWTEDLD